MQRRFGPILSIALCLALGACGGGTGPTGPAPQTGKLRVLITDAPFPYDYVASASIVIEEIRVQVAGEDDDGPWVTVFTGPQEVDLVPLQNGATLPLAEADLEPGTYDQVRVIVSAGEVVLTPEAHVADGDPEFNSANGRLHFPSASQSGLKVHIEGGVEVVTELSSDLLLDFDLSRNFVFNGPVTHAPGVKRVLFTPVVRATNVSTAGSIRTTVSSDMLTPGDLADDLPLAGATVAVHADGDIGVGAPIATGATAEDGQSLISGLAPGTYDLLVSAAGHTAAEVQDVVVVVANVSAAAVTLAASGEIAGDVVTDSGTPDPADDLALEGATVTVAEDGTGTVVAEVQTDASGTFQVTDLAAGLYDLTVAKAGFVTQEVPDVPASLVGGGVHVVLAALFADLRVTVMQAGTAVEGATVVVTDPLGNVVLDAATDALGQVVALALPTATYTVSATLADTTNLVVQVALVGTDPTSTQDAEVAFP